MRKKIIAGNWKMNLNRDDALSLASEIRDMFNDEIRSEVEGILIPPYLYVSSVIQLLKDSSLQVGAQDCSAEEKGAFTGEVSASMLASVGASAVIIGHSERRARYDEKGKLLADKISRVHEAGLRVIYCVGEDLEERENNKQESVVGSQLEESLFINSGIDPSNTLIAYEPVWAIGTGKTAEPEQAQEMHSYIRSRLEGVYPGRSSDFSILYGGSCNESNASALFAQPDVDGGLIGGASLKSRSFINIIKSFE